jgi:hypothetical protein
MTYIGKDKLGQPVNAGDVIAYAAKYSTLSLALLLDGKNMSLSMSIGAIGMKMGIGIGRLQQGK